MSTASWTSSRRRRLAMAINLVLIAGGVLTAALNYDPRDWHPVGLVATLVVFGLASEVLSRRVPATGVSGGAHYTSSAATALAVVFLGPAQALAIAGVGMVVQGIHAGTSRRDIVANLANYSVFIVAGSLLAERAMAEWQIGFGDPAIALVVMGAYVFMEVMSYALLALDDWLAYGRSPRELARAAVRIQLVVETPLMLLAGISGYIYGEGGLVQLVVLAGIQVLFFALAGMVRRSYDRAAALTLQAERISELSASRSQLVGQILTAEERERRRLAESLHDEAMQNLLTARQDLSPDADARDVERARRALDATIDQLRDAIFELHPAVLERVGLAAAIEAVADRAARRGGFEVSVSVAADTEGVSDLLVFTVSRELLANVASHARAAHVHVDVAAPADSVEIEVADDGCGIAPARLGEAPRQGHIGLASTQERIEALGGSFQLDTRPGAGTLVRARIPRRASRAAMTAEPAL